MALRIDSAAAEAIVFGGAILGGGGGGWLEHGLEMARDALAAGFDTVLDIDDFADGLIATASMVGSPAAPERHLEADDFARSVTLLDSALDGRRVRGLTASECGAVACTNGWYQAARLGLHAVDAPCDGRAHPSAQMGSLGLHRDPTFVSQQAAAARVAAALGGRVVARAAVSEVQLDSRGGFDLGLVRLTAGGQALEVSFYNEYMTLDAMASGWRRSPI